MVNSNLINLRLNAEQTTSNSLLTVQKSSKKDSIKGSENKDNNAKNNNIVISVIKYIKDSYIPLVEKLANKNPNEWGSCKKEASDILNVKLIIKLDKALTWIKEGNFEEKSITGKEYMDRSINFAKDACDLIIDLVSTDPSNWNKHKERKQKLKNAFLFIKNIRTTSVIEFLTWPLIGQASKFVMLFMKIFFLVFFLCSKIKLMFVIQSKKAIH